MITFIPLKVRTFCAKFDGFIFVAVLLACAVLSVFALLDAPRVHANQPAPTQIADYISGATLGAQGDPTLFCIQTIDSHSTVIYDSGRYFCTNYHNVRVYSDLREPGTRATANIHVSMRNDSHIYKEVFTDWIAVVVRTPKEQRQYQQQLDDLEKRLHAPRDVSLEVPYNKPQGY